MLSAFPPTIVKSDAEAIEPSEIIAAAVPANRNFIELPSC
jgi:hypothetical protein